MKPEHKLGKLTKITDLRAIWPHEASDFTPWLAQEANLRMLGDEIGIDLTLIGIEESVGNFNIDILAVETGTERKVIIENQLEDTNHDHLGKTITYAAGKEAEVIVWIVKTAREEHRKAVEWLNNHTDDNIGFFLIELELWSIDDSVPALKLNVVERPNDWAKQFKKDTTNRTETEKLRFDYWSELNDYAFSNAEFSKEFKKHKPSTDHWYTLNIGKGSCHIALLMQSWRKGIEIEMYIDDNKELFHSLENHKDEIETIIGCALDWRELPDKKASRILLTKSGVKFGNKSEWSSQFEWLMKYAILFKKAFLKFM